VLTPLTIGFNANDSETLKNLRTCTSSLLKQLSQFFNPDSFGGVLKRMITNTPALSLTTFSFTHQALSISDTTNLIKGYEQLQNVGLLAYVPNSTMLAEVLLQLVFDNAERCTPVQQVLAGELLSLVFSLEIDPDALLNFLLVSVFQEEVN
jgi:hypothetical protein